jgi:predicted nucleic acid-binding protein
MRTSDHQLIMPRTTVDIDAPVLRDLKRLQKQEGKSLGRLVSDLLAQALHHSKTGRAVATLYTRDRDFRRFDFLTVRDPFA